MRRLAFFLAGSVICLALAHQESAQPRWWKGNTHTHTLWSDGDGAPEHVAAWYRDAGYNFLVLSDHNVLSVSERWVPIREQGPLTDERVQALVERFGAQQVALRESPEPAMRLRTLSEVKAALEEPGAFMLIQGEEITGKVHVNGINLTQQIPATKAGSTSATIQAYVDAVAADGEAGGRPTLAHLNHPNFTWAVSPSDVAPIRGALHFEVYNGHPAVHNPGDAEHASTEQLWDLCLALRLGTLGRELLFGVASDDTHAYFRQSADLANSGRGFVMVRSRELSADAIVAAMRRGDYYSSTGVLLEEVTVDEAGMTLRIDAQQGVAYRTEFIGTRLSEQVLGEVGEVLLSTAKNPARYTFAGDELYVRARVVSDAPMANPAPEDGVQLAWTQPVIPGGTSR